MSSLDLERLQLHRTISCACSTMSEGEDMVSDLRCWMLDLLNSMFGKKSQTKDKDWYGDEDLVISGTQCTPGPLRGQAGPSQTLRSHHLSIHWASQIPMYVCIYICTSYILCYGWSSNTETRQILKWRKTWFLHFVSFSSRGGNRTIRVPVTTSPGRSSWPKAVSAPLSAGAVWTDSTWAGFKISKH